MQDRVTRPELRIFREPTVLRGILQNIPTPKPAQPQIVYRKSLQQGILSDLRPSGVLNVKDGKRYIDGEFVKRFGFHTFRHSLTSWLIANGGNP